MLGIGTSILFLCHWNKQIYNIMTLKELLTQVSFDELLPSLKKHEPDHLDDIYCFREAYDILLGMEPDKDFKGEAHVEWSGGEYGDEQKWIGVHHLDDNVWKKELAKEIIVADDVHLSFAELAMHCLWEITYWGFSPTEIREGWQKRLGHKQPVNFYEVALDKLEESIWRHQTPRRLRCKGPDGERCTLVEFPLKREDDRKNRSKRKREYRQDKREEYLRKMAARENLVRMLSAEGSNFRRSDVDFLLGIEYGTRYDYRSVTQDTDARLDYILESMTRYQQLDSSQYDGALLFLRIPSDAPLKESALAAFKQGVEKWLGYADIRFGCIIGKADSSEVTVTLLLNKC